MWIKIIIIIAIVLLIAYFYYYETLPGLEKKPLKNINYKSVGEEMCAKVIEEYFNREPTINSRPSFLRNPETGKCMELDVYDKVSRTAVEYNGIQHYTYPNTFHKTLEEFEKQKKRDKIKKKICKKEKINLIVVPYSVDDGFRDKQIRHSLIKEFIISRLEKQKNSF